MVAELLLLSSSRVHGSGYLEYARSALQEFLAGCHRLHFAPFAIADYESYTNTVGQAFAELGVEVIGLQRGDALAEIQSADGLFVGGGNSFRLLKRLRDLELLQPIRDRVRSGALRYVGASAGSNMACPSLRTTNDMPIVQPGSFEALGLVPFQINPHYVAPDSGSTHMGETRDDRLREFLEENDVPVVGLREGAWLRLSGSRMLLGGEPGARVFRRGQQPTDLEGGSDVSWLLDQTPRFDQPGY
jgi:dipeptidase E